MYLRPKKNTNKRQTKSVPSYPMESDVNFVVGPLRQPFWLLEKNATNPSESRIAVQASIRSTHQLMSLCPIFPLIRSWWVAGSVFLMPQKKKNLFCSSLLWYRYNAMCQNLAIRCGEIPFLLRFYCGFSHSSCRERLEANQLIEWYQFVTLQIELEKRFRCTRATLPLKKHAKHHKFSQPQSTSNPDQTISIHWGSQNKPLFLHIG